MNIHLENAGSKKRVMNFSRDIQDSEAYAVLLGQVAAADGITPAMVQAVLSETDMLKRAELICAYAESIGCLRFVRPYDIADGNPRLNLAFVATLFAKYPGVGPSKLSVAEKRIAELES